MHRFALVIALGLSTPAVAQNLVPEPNGTVTGVFLGQDIAFDVACSRSPLFPGSAEVTTHTPLSQSLIGSVTEDALSISMLNNGAAFLANINGETHMSVDTEFGAPEFPVSTSSDDFDIVISCPEDF